MPDSIGSPGQLTIINYQLSIIDYPMPRKLLSILALVILGVLLFSQMRGLRDPKVLPPDDFVEYWAAGHLNLEGKNPYDSKLLIPLEEEAGRWEAEDLRLQGKEKHAEGEPKKREAVMMWNPPWTLSFVMPYGAIHPFDAKVLWLLQNFLLVLISADWLWRIYGGPRHLRWLPPLLALSFVPTLLVLGAGQIGPLILFGITLFLALEKGGYPWLAGSAGVLMAIKPHLVYLFWPTLAVWSLFRGWKIVTGGIIAGILATLIPLIFNPHVLSDFWQELTQRPPWQWESPTLGTVIRMLEAQGRGIDESQAFALQFIPGLFGILWLIWYGWSSRKDPWVWRDRLPLLLLVSFFTASYGAWPFDLVILLPAVICVAVHLARDPSPRNLWLGLSAWLLLNVPALIQNMVYEAYSFWYLWMSPLMLALYVGLMHFSSGGRKSPEMT